MKFRETTWVQWPIVDAEQMREVDRIMIDELHITLLQMMENAGRNLALLAPKGGSPPRGSWSSPAAEATAGAGSLPPDI